MTSTSITTIGGVVVVTQVIPQDQTSIPLQNPAAATNQQPPPPDTKAPPTTPAKMDDMTATFLRGQPQGLGVVQIFIGVLCVLFSLTAAFSRLLIVHAPFCLAVAFVVSGSLAVAAWRRTSVTLVWASLVSNMISVTVSLGGVVYLCWLLASRPLSIAICDAEAFGGFSSEDERSTCMRKMWSLDTVMYGLLSSFLVLLVLQLCVAVSVCVFSGKTIRCHVRRSPVTVKVDDHSRLLSSAASEYSSDVALLGSEGSETSGLP